MPRMLLIDTMAMKLKDEDCVSIGTLAWTRNKTCSRVSHALIAVVVVEGVQDDLAAHVALVVPLHEEEVIHPEEEVPRLAQMVTALLWTEKAREVHLLPEAQLTKFKLPSQRTIMLTNRER